MIIVEGKIVKMESTSGAKEGGYAVTTCQEMTLLL